jgi:DNA mismatch endonuclease (patch repair protein)
MFIGMPFSKLSERSRTVTDKITPEHRSKIMSHIRSKNTAPEMIVRRVVHGMGYRYRLHRKDLPGKPDLVFPGRHKIIFVHGCVWHQHIGCKDGHLPKSNHKYWIPKLDRNTKRDKKAMEALAEMGWEVLVIWECEITNRDRLSIKLNLFLSANTQIVPKDARKASRR